MNARQSVAFAALASVAMLAPAARAQCARYLFSPQQLGDPDGVSSTVYDSISWDADGPGPGRPQLVLCGMFARAGGVSPGRVVSWDGGQWHQMITGTVANGVFTMVSWDPDGPGPQNPYLIAGGEFVTLASMPANRVAKFDGTSWSTIGGLDNIVYKVITWDPDGPGPGTDLLVAGGDFSGHVASWNGSGWSTIGGGLNGTVYALTSWDPDGPGPATPVLVAGGTFTGLGAGVKRVAMYNGVQWVALDQGFNNTVRTLATWDPDGSGPQPPMLIAGGEFTATGAVSGAQPLAYVARWTGSIWQQMGAGVDGPQVRSSTTWDPDGPGPLGEELVIGGAFNISGAVNVNSLARWDGSAWRPLGNGVDNAVFSLHPWNPDGGPPELIITGFFTRVISGPTSFRWARWTATGAPWFTAQPQSVDLTSPGGSVSFTTGVPYGYDDLGTLSFQWTRNGSPVSDGPGGVSPGGGTVSGASGTLVGAATTTLTIMGVAASDVGTFRCTVTGACGDVTTQGATLTIAGATCPADLNGDGQVDFSDYLEFLNLYDAQDPAADFNQDGQVDFSDYLEFLNHYDASC